VGLGIDGKLELAGAWMELELGAGLLSTISERLMARPKSCEMVSVPKLVRSFRSDGEVVAPWQMFVLLEVWVVPGKKVGGNSASGL